MPILKIRDNVHNLEVDLNYNNVVGIRNTHLLYCYSQSELLHIFFLLHINSNFILLTTLARIVYYGQLCCPVDWRVRPLVLVVKMWAHCQHINDARRMTISSYSLVLMVIHFLQCKCLYSCLSLSIRKNYQRSSAEFVHREF